MWNEGPTLARLAYKHHTPLCCVGRLSWTSPWCFQTTARWKRYSAGGRGDANILLLNVALDNHGHGGLVCLATTQTGCVYPQLYIS